MCYSVLETCLGPQGRTVAQPGLAPECPASLARSLSTGVYINPTASAPLVQSLCQLFIFVFLIVRVLKSKEERARIEMMGRTKGHYRRQPGGPEVLREEGGDTQNMGAKVRVTPKDRQPFQILCRV